MLNLVFKEIEEGVEGKSKRSVGEDIGKKQPGDIKHTRKRTASPEQKEEPLAQTRAKKPREEVKVVEALDTTKDLQLVIPYLLS